MLLHVCRGVATSRSPDLRWLLSTPRKFQSHGLHALFPIRPAKEWSLRNRNTAAAASIYRKSAKAKNLETEARMAEETVEMDQLLSMGFSNELAAQALAATGGQSVLKATEWILSHRSSDAKASNLTNPSQVQPKLDKFFRTSQKSSESHDGSEKKSQEPVKVTKRPRKDPQSPTRVSARGKSRSKTRQEPLSERMRPRTIHEVVGQEHLLSSNSLLVAAIERNQLPSIILWGPPGTGKTSIARSIVNSFKDQSFYRFVSISAVTTGVKDIRDAVEEAKKLKLHGNRTVLFVDEVHRFNKSQQDSFLPVIEDGSIVFMGATTENPSFHLITPLLSRCRVLTLNPLKPHHIETLLKRAAEDEFDRGLAKSVGMKVEVKEDAIRFLAANSDGDARVALNALEISATTAAARVPQSGADVEDGESAASKVIVTLDDAKEALQCKHLAYDRGGEEHYNLISALHKSMRGGDANAAIYWLARMLQGGEQPLYIARRLIRFASEDVGLADPLALNQAVSCYQACHFLGMPECNVILGQCAAYLALAPKSVAVYRAIEAAQQAVKDSVGQNEGVPLHLRNAPTKLMKELGYGEGYLYPPDNPSAYGQSYLPPSVQGHKFLDWPENRSANPEES